MPGRYYIPSSGETSPHAKQGGLAQTECVYLAEKFAGLPPVETPCLAFGHVSPRRDNILRDINVASLGDQVDFGPHFTSTFVYFQCCFYYLSSNHRSCLLYILVLKGTIPTTYSTRL